jgi:hypothetical protein
VDAKTLLLCAYLLDARQAAESEGHLDFSAVVEATGSGETTQLTAKVDMGTPYGVGRITFSGHNQINDSTLRRAMTLRERDPFDVGQLRRSLERINDSGLVEPLSLADLVITRHADRATADLTIPLRERGRRWWLLAGPVIPGLGSYHASISSRLPPWGRGVVDASTYLITFNLLGLARPLLGVLPLLSDAPPLDFARGSPEQGRRAPVAIALERPYLPGQGLLSGFALSPQLSARSTIGYYGRTHLSRLLHATLDETATDPLVIPITGGSQASGKLLVCNPSKQKLWWLRRGLVQATDIALALVLP